VQHDRRLLPRRTSQKPGLGSALIAGALMAVVLLLAIIGMVSTGWEPLRTAISCLFDSGVEHPCRRSFASTAKFDDHVNHGQVALT